jgi:hypothetical protein
MSVNIQYIPDRLWFQTSNAGKRFLHNLGDRRKSDPAGEKLFHCYLIGCIERRREAASFRLRLISEAKQGETLQVGRFEVPGPGL